MKQLNIMSDLFEKNSIGGGGEQNSDLARNLKDHGLFGLDKCISPIRPVFIIFTAFLLAFGLNHDASAQESKAKISNVQDITGKAGAMGTKVVNGFVTSRFPAVGALLKDDSAHKELDVNCSGTLIGCSTFLTAAHCVSKDPDPKRYRVFLPNAGIFGVVPGGIHWQKKKFVWPTTSGSRADVAVLQLDQSVNGIRTEAINDVSEVVTAQDGTISGYGLTGTANRLDSGIKRYGGTKTQKCKFSKPHDMICWSYGAGTPGKDSNTCNGDSGGPFFATVKRETVVAGVTSGGTKLNCGKGDHAYDTSVHAHIKWIKSIHKTASRQACGELPALPDSADSPRHYGWYGSIDDNIKKHVLRFSISDTKTLRVAMNATEGIHGAENKSDFDLRLLPGKTQDTSKAACVRNDASQVAFCEIKNPAQGPWTVVVMRKKGKGQFQITASVF